jgi:multisubunit Na+/H+ antiporter MnhC subunit
MDFTVAIVALFGLLSIGVLFLFARRALRLIVRLALAGALVLLLVIGAFVYWWHGPGESSNTRPVKPAANAPRKNSR